MTPNARWIPLLLILGGTGCSRDKADAVALVQAVQRFRTASNDERPNIAPAVTDIQCGNRSVCEVKAQCVKSVQATSRGLSLKREVQLAIEDLRAARLSPADPRAGALSGKLSEAEQQLVDGIQTMAACEVGLRRLAVEYGF